MAQTPSRKTKTCPYCTVPLSVDAEECFSCKKKVGKIDKHGIASKPANYMAYVVCLLVWVALYLYVRYVPWNF